MSKLLILNNDGSENKYSIVELKNIEHFEERMGKPDTSNDINEYNAHCQNIGVYSVYARETIKKNPNMQSIFIEICRRSVGEFRTTTDRISQEEIAREVGLSSRTTRKYLKKLEEEGFIKINKSDHKTLASGSFSSSYTPIFKQ